MKRKKSPKRTAILITMSVVLTLLLLYFAPASTRSRTWTYFLKIVPTVAIATFVGSILELRNWIRWMKVVLRPLISFGKLPQLSGVAMVMALFSNKSAGALLSGALSDGEISQKELRVTAMCNSYLAYVSHSLRIFFPTVGAIGLAGFYYFGIQFTLGFLIICVALLIHRRSSEITSHNSSCENSSERTPPSWGDTFKRATRRTWRVVLRLVFISVPSYLIVRWLSSKGVFEMWQEMMPEQLAHFFPAEVMAVTVSMLGGIVNAATVGGEFLQGGELSNTQVVFAMLVGSAMGNPVRTIRRNLPSAMGIFHPKDGLFIVGVMQSARFVTVILVCLFLGLYMTLL